MKKYFSLCFFNDSVCTSTIPWMQLEYSTFPMKWNSIFVRRVKKTVFRFPFYRISILSRMKLQSFSDFHFRPMSQFPSKCNTLAHENSAGEFPQHTQLFSLTKRTFKTKWTFENMFVFMFCFNHTTQRAVYRLRQTQQDKRRRCSGGECVMDFHFQQNWFGTHAAVPTLWSRE